MALPEDWDGVNWAPSVVILSDVTEGVPTLVIPSHRYPQLPRGYFMMAYLDSNRRQVVGYNAAEVGAGGKQMSEFVFWHELGHHHLGHTGTLGPDSMDVTYTSNNETDADRHSYSHWMGRRDVYGLMVVREAIAYFARQGNAPGDAQHPAPAARGAALLQLLRGEQLRQFTIHNDQTTRPDFVREVLMQCFSFHQVQADALIQTIETNGSTTIAAKGVGRTARLIERNEADKIVHFVTVKKSFANQPAFNMTCGALV